MYQWYEPKVSYLALNDRELGCMSTATVIGKVTYPTTGQVASIFA